MNQNLYQLLMKLKWKYIWVVHKVNIIIQILDIYVWMEDGLPGKIIMLL